MTTITKNQAKSDSVMRLIDVATLFKLGLDQCADWQSPVQEGGSENPEDRGCRTPRDNSAALESD